ncbi:hypothetical protein N7507_000294 [Penicillium longicatenatum]|nr:hypothetical protein N7507_000294 [Penicillium longicatenatum]
MMLEELTQDKKRLRATRQNITAKPGSNTGSSSQAAIFGEGPAGQKRLRESKNAQQTPPTRPPDRGPARSDKREKQEEEEEKGGDKEAAERGRGNETEYIVDSSYLEERLAEAEAFVAQMREELEEERLIEAAERLRVESQTPGVVLPPPDSSFFPVLESVAQAMVIEDDDPDKIDWGSPKKE